MDAIPRNAMGKFNKKELVTLFAEWNKERRRMHF